MMCVCVLIVLKFLSLDKKHMDKNVSNMKANC